MLRCAIVFLLILALPLRANLGDSVNDCVKRYGKPVNFTEASGKMPFGTLVFIAGPYQMIVFLLNNVEVGARVSKKDKSAFTPDEMKTIMDADATSPWVTADSIEPATQRWKRADKATVLYDESAKMLIFTSQEMADALHAQAAAAPSPVLAPKPPEGNFAPAAPAQWSLLSTNAAPATNSAPTP